MGLRINTNVAALNAARTLRNSTIDLNRSLERLSSGLRINSGKDAPAGLIASETLRSEIAGINQAIDNSQRAGNVINTAEGALSEVSALLLEVQTLTNQAANSGALSPEEIKANQLQVDAILTSINRIANTTQFNGVKLLNGSLDYTTSGVVANDLRTVTINAAKLPDNGSTRVVVEVTGSAQLAEVQFSGSALGASGVTVRVAGNAGTEQFSFAASTATSAIAFSINQLKEATGVSAVVSGAVLRFTSTEYGSDRFVTLTTISGTFVNGTDKGVDASVNINGAQADVKGLDASIRNSGLDATFRLTAAFGTTTGSTSFDITGGGARFQIGSEVNRPGQSHIGIASVSTSSLGNETVGRLAQIGRASCRERV